MTITGIGIWALILAAIECLGDIFATALSVCLGILFASVVLIKVNRPLFEEMILIIRNMK